MFTKTSNPITKDEIVKIGKHYTQYNGGYPEKEYFYSDMADMEQMIQRFLPLNNVVEKNSMYKEQMRDVMARYFPFANDYRANPFCIDLTTEEICVIYMDVEAITETLPTRIAENFESFVSELSETIIDDDD